MDFIGHLALHPLIAIIIWNYDGALDDDTVKLLGIEVRAVRVYQQTLK